MFCLYVLVKLLNDPESVVSNTAHLGILKTDEKESNCPGRPSQTQREKLRSKFPVVPTHRKMSYLF